MAGRIRSIKPEILEDEKTAALPHLAWRLFVSLWLIADDYGNLRGDPTYLQGQALWAANETRESVASALNTLAEVGLITRYTVRGQGYCHIAGWAKHQRVTHPGKARMPGPEEADTKQSPIVGEAQDGVARTSGDIPETRMPDLRPPITDREGISPARDLAPPVTPEEISRKARQSRRAELWSELEAARRKTAASLRLEARPLPVQDPGERELASLLASGDLDRVTEDVRHAIAIAVLEAIRDRSVQWLSGGIFAERSFRRLVAMTPEDASKPRGNGRGPPGPSRPKRLAPTSIDDDPNFGTQDPQTT